MLEMDGLKAPPAEPGTVSTRQAPRPASDVSPTPRPDADGTTPRPRRILHTMSDGRLLVAAAVVVVAAGIVLRFIATSNMWLDEALTFNIARLPLGQIHGALRRDGAPPLYYYLLHFWMRAFGTSDAAVRSMSGVFSCATLPLVWVAGRRMGGRSMAACALVLVATSPFAIRYASENRMYALVGLLSAAGVVALQHVLRRPTWWNALAVGAVAGLLLYTHYWALYLVGVTLLWLLFQARWGPEGHRHGARVGSLATALGCVTFLPWLPTFLFQAHHTGTPWAKPADFAAMVNAVTSFAGGATNQGRALALVYFALAGLGLFGLARGKVLVELDLRTRPRARVFAIVVAGTLAAAIVGGFTSGSAFQARYAWVVFVPLVLLVALGLGTFADRSIRAGVLAATVAFGLASGIPTVWTSRTQAGQVASALATMGKPGDVVAFCPDQLGPSVNRLLPSGRYRQITFPRGIGPAFVDWVDYARASAAGSPAAFVAELERLSAPDHQIWLVWAPGYQTFGTKCEAIETDLVEDSALRARQIFAPGKVADAWTGYENMDLVRYVQVGG